VRTKSIFDKCDAYQRTIIAKKEGYYSYFKVITSEQDTEVYLANGKKVLMLGSNSYMGLTNHPEVKEAARQAITKYGTGCAGSPFLNGTLDIHEELSAELAAFVGKESAILYSTGFGVNQGVISSLTGRHDFIFMDVLNHASIIEGARLAHANIKRYKHNDMEDLERLLASVPREKGKFIVADGIFSMDGDILKLPQVIALAEKYEAVVMVDDAHALGVIGPKGDGTAAHFGLTAKTDLIMGTFSKSLASIGGLIAGDEQTMEFLRHHSRALIFSASMPPASAASALAALRIIKREPWRIEKLWKNTTMLREGLQKLGFDTGLSETPVIPFFVGEDMLAFIMRKRLEEEGIFVNPVINPAVPKDKALIRLSLMSNHTEEQIAFALEKIALCGREIGIIQ